MAFPSYTKTFHSETYPAIDPARPELYTAGKVVFITGGGSGIGPRIIHAFATAGSTKITIIGRTESSLLSAKKEVEAQHSGVKVLTFVADIVDAAAVNKAFKETKKAFGPVDILVSNAAYLPDVVPLAKTDVNEFWKGFEINVKGNLILSQAFLANSSEKPTLISINTGGAHVPPMMAGMGAYAVSKIAASKLMDYFGMENPNVRVMTIHPGVLKSAMNDKSMEAGLVLPFDDGESCISCRMDEC
jgi:NAD(P)-dependent dehydrogenase (short-subunit alcohol dehydrogenase family)